VDKVQEWTRQRASCETRLPAREPCKQTESKTMSDPSVLFIGNATRDSVYFVPHLPANDEVCSVSRRVSCLGGRGVVPALVGSALGLRSTLCTVIGADLKSEFEPFLDTHGVRKAIKWDEIGSSTTKYVAFIDESEAQVSAVALAPNLDWTPTDAQRRDVEGASGLYFSTNDLSFNKYLLSCVRAGEQEVLHNLGVRLKSHPPVRDAARRCSPCSTPSRRSRRDRSRNPPPTAGSPVTTRSSPCQTCLLTGRGLRIRIRPLRPG
jgi:hypothetical protein